MGLFNILKNNIKANASKQQSKITQEDNSVVDLKNININKKDRDNIHNENITIENNIITFEERKRQSIPSLRGLYVAEILLLEYCTYGNYPNPDNNYPRFWWYEYGVSDVNAVLKSLEKRGFIALSSLKEAAGCLKIPELKSILSSHGEKTTGRKADMLVIVKKVATEEELLSFGVVPKYHLTELGEKELEENAYVSYMHHCENKTIENSPFGFSFNVWSINKILGFGDKTNWKEIVDEQEEILKKNLEINRKNFMERLKKNDPEEYKILLLQEKQLNMIKLAREKYDNEKDIYSYIDFWEKIWADGGLKFEGSKWLFELVDLYIEVQRYDEALELVKKIKKIKPFYDYRSEKYIQKIEKIKNTK